MSSFMNDPQRNTKNMELTISRAIIFSNPLKIKEEKNNVERQMFCEQLHVVKIQSMSKIFFREFQGFQFLI